MIKAIIYKTLRLILLIFLIGAEMSKKPITVKNALVRKKPSVFSENDLGAA